jgi:transcriptional regulator with XRE-family HTH domain
MAESQEQFEEAEPIGSRLKAAREAQGLSLDDVAAKTRVPIRHLQHMERGEWDELPAPTYSVGFARAYANAVGLNGSEIGAELRAQIGSVPSVAATAQYEPADPARVPPRALAIAAAIIAILLAAGYLLWRSGAVDDTAVDQNQIAGLNPSVSAPAAAPATPPPAAVPAPVTGPVVLTATDEVWLRVYDGKGGPKLLEKTLASGERYEVPATAAHPLILTGRPNALKVTVGGRAVPPLGEPEKTIADVSLLPADLVARAGAAAQTPPLRQQAQPVAAAPANAAPATPVPAAR